MATFKIVNTFIGQQGDKFGEDFYRDAPDLASASTFTAEYVLARLRLLDDQNRWMSTRISDIRGNRTAQTIVVNQTGVQGPDSPPSTPGQAAVWNLASVGSGSRKWWLRGMPSSFVLVNKDTARQEFSPQGGGFMVTFLTEAAKAGLGVLKLLPLARTPDNFPPIVAVAFNANASLTDITIQNNNPGIAANDRVIISSVSQKDYPGLQGQFLVLKQVGNVLTIQYKMPPYTQLPPISGKLRMQKYVNPISPFAPAKCSFAYFNTHKTQNPFTGSRGRRSAGRIRGSS